MTELILALFIAFLGAVSIIGVFPVGFDANRKAMGTIQVADAANQFLFYFANEIRADWQMTQAFPNSKPMSKDGDDPAGNGKISGAGVSTSVNGNSVGDGDGVRNGEDDRQVLWSQESVIDNANIQIRFAGLNTSDTFDPVVHNSGVFRITQTTSNHVVDFDDIVRSWLETSVTTPGTAIGPDGQPTSPREMMFFAEVSWPLHLSYLERRKSVFNVLLFNPGYPVCPEGAGNNPEWSIMPWGILTECEPPESSGSFCYVNGRTYILKYTSGGQVAPGNFGALGLGGKGAQFHQANVEDGYSGGIAGGDAISPRPG